MTHAERQRLLQRAIQLYKAQLRVENAVRDLSQRSAELEDAERKLTCARTEYQSAKQSVDAIVSWIEKGGAPV